MRGNALIIAFLSDSFIGVKQLLIDLYLWDHVETKSIIIVGTKAELVRKRQVSLKGKVA